MIILEELDFFWTKGQIDKAAQMYRDGYSGGDIAERLERDPDEVALLLMHLRRIGRIRGRKGGWYGDNDGISLDDREATWTK